MLIVKFRGLIDKIIQVLSTIIMGAILFIFYALIFIGEDLRDMKQGPKTEAAKEA